MTALLLSLFLTTAFPSSSRTSWMSPQSFHLVIGMKRAEVLKTLGESGWTLKRGRNDDEMVVDYSDDKALTLEFRKERLRSIRFELFAILPEIRAAFTEQKQLLVKEHGTPKRGQSKVVVYDDRLPNIMVVLSDDPKSEYGRKGIGFLAVRYYDPVAMAGAR
jgi:hypothetical protein